MNVTKITAEEWDDNCERRFPCLSERSLTIPSKNLSGSFPINPLANYIPIQSDLGVSVMVVSNYSYRINLAPSQENFTIFQRFSFQQGTLFVSHFAHSKLEAVISACSLVRSTVDPYKVTFSQSRDNLKILI